jgi:hypothetical protein
MSDGEASDDTNKHSSRNSHKYKVRYDIKLVIPPTHQPAQAAYNLLKDFLSRIQMSDTTAIIEPWYSNERSLPQLEKGSHFPTQITPLRRYFPNLWEGKGIQNHNMYTSVYLFHSDPISEIREGIKDWMRSAGHGVFDRPLQYDLTAEIGWLLYSTRETNTETLAQSIFELTGVQCGLRWKTIDAGQQGKLNKNNQVRALHVEVPKKDRWANQHTLLKMYGGTSAPEKGYPLNIKLRFIKPLKEVQNIREKVKLGRLKDRQKTFETCVTTQMDEDVTQLDFRPDDLLPTLREMIMCLKSTEYPTRSLFLSVGHNTWKGLHFFQYYAYLEAEAQIAIFNLIPILKYKFPNSKVEQYFTDDAVLRNRHSVWDDETKQVVSILEEGKAVEEEEEVDEELNFCAEAIKQKETAKLQQQQQQQQQPSSTMDNPTTNTPRPEPTNLHNTVDDQDSVSTFGTTAGGLSTSGATNIISVPRNNLTQNSDTISLAGSTVTMETIATLESRVQKLDMMIVSQNDKLDRLLQLTRTVPQADQPGTATSAGAAPSNAGGRS